MDKGKYLLKNKDRVKFRIRVPKLVMPKKDTFTGNDYRGYELGHKNQKYSKRFLDKAIDLIDTMTERHSKVSTVRIDVRYPRNINSDGTNKDFQAVAMPSGTKSSGQTGHSRSRKRV